VGEGVISYLFSSLPSHLEKRRRKTNFTGETVLKKEAFTCIPL
jgi:hypothetical protein